MSQQILPPPDVSSEPHHDGAIPTAPSPQDGTARPTNSPLPRSSEGNGWFIATMSISLLVVMLFVGVMASRPSGSLPVQSPEVAAATQAASIPAAAAPAH